VPIAIDGLPRRAARAGWRDRRAKLAPKQRKSDGSTACAIAFPASGTEAGGDFGAIFLPNVAAANGEAQGG